jgi:hypothetical protein
MAFHTPSEGPLERTAAVPPSNASESQPGTTAQEVVTSNPKGALAMLGATGIVIAARALWHSALQTRCCSDLCWNLLGAVSDWIAILSHHRQGQRLIIVCLFDLCRKLLLPIDLAHADLSGGNQRTRTA